MKKILILSALLIVSANAENYREVCVSGINPFGDKRKLDVCIMVPKSKIDASTKQKIIMTYSMSEIEEISTWKGKEIALSNFCERSGIKSAYYSKLSITHPCDK